MHAPAPQEGGHGVHMGGAVSWDPAVFRPERRVSCYSGEIFSDVTDQVRPSQKPGRGFKKPDCGKWIRKIKSGEEIKDIFHNCDNLNCPVCMPGAITKKARNIQERFELYEQAKVAENAVLIPGEKRGSVSRHFAFTISPEHQAELVAMVRRTSGRWNEGLFYRLFREEYHQAIKISGLVGGLSVYHDARVRHPDTGNTGKRAKHLIVLEAKLAGNMKDEDPAWKIYDHIRKQKRPWDYYYFSPHFHAIAFGKIIGVEEFEKAMPGWTYHNKGNVETPGGLVRYLLSHMAMLVDKKAVSWFGRLSSKCLGKVELRTYEKEEVHPVTGKPWIIIESVIPEEVGSVCLITVTEYRSFFRTAQKRQPPDIGDKIKFRNLGKRSMCPSQVREKGILVMARFCDEFGKL
jgi:hypothetical protein